MPEQFENIDVWTTALVALVRSNDRNMWQQGDMYLAGVQAFGYLECRARAEAARLDWKSLVSMGCLARKEGIKVP